MAVWRLDVDELDQHVRLGALDFSARRPDIHRVPGDEHQGHHRVTTIASRTPPGFARAVEEANTTRLAAAPRRSRPARTARRTAGRSGSGATRTARAPSALGAPADDASARARSPSHPRRAARDRQTTRPVEAQAAERRDAMPHVRVRGVAMFPELASRTLGDPTRLEGVRFVPSATTKKSAATTTRPGFVASEEAPVETPWLPDVPDATRPGCIDAAREFWAHPADAPGSLVRGVALAARRPVVRPRRRNVSRRRRRLPRRSPRTGEEDPRRRRRRRRNTTTTAAAVPSRRSSRGRRTTRSRRANAEGAPRRPVGGSSRGSRSTSRFSAARATSRGTSSGPTSDRPRRRSRSRSRARTRSPRPGRTPARRNSGGGRSVAPS